MRMEQPHGFTPVLFTRPIWVNTLPRRTNTTEKRGTPWSLWTYPELCTAPIRRGGFTFWVVMQCVCLAGLWCGNVIQGANTGLLTSEGCSLPWMPPSRGEAHFDDGPHLWIDSKRCIVFMVHCMDNSIHRQFQGRNLRKGGNYILLATQQLC